VHVAAGLTANVIHARTCVLTYHDILTDIRRSLVGIAKWTGKHAAETLSNLRDDAL